MSAGVPALLAGGLTSLALEGPVPWIVGAAVGVPIFILVMVIPMLFLGGLVALEPDGQKQWCNKVAEAAAVLGEDSVRQTIN